MKAPGTRNRPEPPRQVPLPLGYGEAMLDHRTAIEVNLDHRSYHIHGRPPDAAGALRIAIGGPGRN